MHYQLPKIYNIAWNIKLGGKIKLFDIWENINPGRVSEREREKENTKHVLWNKFSYRKKILVLNGVNNLKHQHHSSMIRIEPYIGIITRNQTNIDDNKLPGREVHEQRNWNPRPTMDFLNHGSRNCDSTPEYQLEVPLNNVELTSSS